MGIFFIVFACKNNEKGNNTTVKDSVANDNTNITSSQPVKLCYAQKNKDTVLLNIELNGDKVTGELYINRFEKDVNRGTINGTMKGDTLFADYTFNAEGMQSVREVVFLKKDDVIIEGYGPLKYDSNNKAVFTNKDSLMFDEKMKLDKVACEE
ncbi:MAG: hypothetical protein ACTHJ5_18160 [Ilyomonas sp.]